MNAADRERVARIVATAQEMSPEQSSAYVDRECGSDGALRVQVESLLSASRSNDVATIDAVNDVATIDHPSAGTQQDSHVNIPGYQVVKTLGRGGMGIVCLAQDLKLPRMVALKMIRSGSDADEKEKARFQAEAAAVAQLVHPNIVQIHDLGVHAGQPYFVLEYVGGGTLAQKLAQAPPSPEQAAEVTLTLAKAVQFAHQRGIIHRDIKPANVLLTVEGSPKITDFGLAKQLDADQALSLAGDIMGTPSYMAPEQALGRIQDIGPATDIYALGAVLYEMLTGRPPFKGETTLDTLDLVRQQEPVSPRTIRPRIARDLETICLKCLHKDRAKRYTSALALAQDLERFLAGEAILARPEGIVSKLTRRIRRNRAVSLLGVALMAALLATGFFVYRAGESSRLLGLENRLARERVEAVWADDDVQAHEALIDQLHVEAPTKGMEARQAFHKSLFDSGNKPLQKPTALQPDDEAHARRMIALLTPRDGKLAQDLQASYQARLRAWEEVFKNTAPRRIDAAFVRYPSNANPSLLTKIACKGNVRLESSWTNWEATSEIGLILHGEPAKEKTGYAFLLETHGPTGIRPTFADVRRGIGTAHLNILRNGLSIRKTAIDIAKLPVGALRLEAQREGDLVRIHVNADVSMKTSDIIPLSPHGVYGMVWPREASLGVIRGLRQAMPIEPGRLEQGDEMFAQGKFEDARAFYGKQAIELSGTLAGLEARYKECLVLDHLKKNDDAFAGYQALAAEMKNRGANKWTVLASFQLLVHHMRKKQMAQADSIVESLLLHRSADNAENLILYVPDDVRSEILGAYHDSAVGIGLWRFDARRVKNTRRLVQLDELLGTPYSTAELNQLALIRALRRDGQVDEAIAWLEDRLSKLAQEGKVSVVFPLEYGWLMREKGTPERALLEINRQLSDPHLPPVVAAPFVVERARLHVAMKNNTAARRDLNHYFAKFNLQNAPYRQWSDACLILGTMREQEGDHVGALEAWRKGKFNAKITAMSGDITNGTILINLLLLDTLCQDLTEHRTEALLRSLIRKQRGIETMLDLIDARGLFKSSTGMMNRMWQSPRGKVIAAKLAFQDCTFQEYMRFPAQVFLAEMAREESIAKLTPDQDELLWRFCEDGVKAFESGKISDAQVMQLALLWKRGPTFLGGIEIVKKVDPALRGPAAYLYGKRFQRLGRPAAEAFRMAFENAPPNSPLARLAREELDKASKK